MLPTGSVKKIGLIAGAGQFPRLFCRAARDRGYQVIITALRGQADPDLESLGFPLTWIRLGEVGKGVKVFRREGVSQAVMLGGVKKLELFSGNFRPDWLAIKYLPRMKRLKDFNDDTLLRFLAEVLADQGVEVVESTIFLPDLPIPAGVLTKRKPSSREMKDAEHGFRLAKDMGRFDVGQCIVIRNRAVLAVESAEGTDKTILRGGVYGRGKAMVIKVVKPNQDLRFDLPCIGLKTIETMIEAKCAALVVEAGGALCFDRDEVIKLADRHRICIIGMENKQ